MNMKNKFRLPEVLQCLIKVMRRKHLNITPLAATVMISIVFLFCGCAGGGSADLLPPDATKPVDRLSQSEIEKLGALTSFEYNYGSFNGGAYEFMIININETTSDAPVYRFIAEGSNGVDMYANAEVGADVLADLKEIIVSQNIFTWDGFDKRDKNLLDGYGFDLTVAFENGSIEASGYEKYPANHAQGHRALSEFLEALANSLAGQEIRAADEVSIARVIFKEEAGKYEMRKVCPDTDDGQFEEFAAFLVEQYHQFRNESGNESGEYCEVRLEVLPDGKEPVRYCDVVIDKARFPDAYDAILEKTLAVDGKPSDYFNSEEFKTVLYKEKFIYPVAFLYDSSGLGKVVIDMPEQTITWNGETYTASREAMLEFYKYADRIPHNGTDIWKHELEGDYKDKGTAHEVFDASIVDGYTWLIGKNHKQTYFLYGDKGKKLDGWDGVVAEFENMIKMASKS